jgi:hypothetical protein
MSVILRYIEGCQHVGPNVTAQSIPVESKYEFKNLQTQDLHFTAENTPSVTETKDGSACKSLQSLCVFTLSYAGCGA